MKLPRWELYADRWGYWRWRLIAKNGKIVASGEAHTRKQSAKRAMQGVVSAATQAVVTEK